MLEIADQVRSLLRLHTVDAERYEVQTELAATPKELAASRATLDLAVTARDTTEAACKNCKKAIAANERDMEGVERRRDRAKGRMPNLVTSTQIEATQREIAALTQEASELEEKVLEGMEQLEELEASLDEQRLAVDAGEAELASRLEAWSAREAELSSRLAELDTTREPLFEGLRSDVARRYLIGWKRSWKPPSGITGIDNLICTTCNGRVSPMWVQESLNHRALHACDTCKRLIIFDPDAEPEPATEEPVEA